MPKTAPSIVYFSAKLDHQVWEAIPLSGKKAFNVNYKALSHQLSILATGKDGSKIEISFHDIEALKVGSYPSTLHDNGVQSGIFYSPRPKNQGLEMASVSYDQPVQENTVCITQLDKSDPEAYVIEGTFSAKLYALSIKNQQRSIDLTHGKFRVIYYPDAYHPSF